jgi:hypothetical protein
MMPSMLPRYDDEPDKIRISQRDSFGISDVLAFSSMALMMVSRDFFLSTLLMDNQTHNDRPTEGLFLGCNMENKAIITNFGWVVEMRILCCSALFCRKKTNLVLILSGNKTIPTKIHFIDSKLGTFTHKLESLKE